MTTDNETRHQVQDMLIVRKGITLVMNIAKVGLVLDGGRKDEK